MLVDNLDDPNAWPDRPISHAVNDIVAISGHACRRYLGDASCRRILTSASAYHGATTAPSCGREPHGGESEGTQVNQIPLEELSSHSNIFPTSDSKCWEYFLWNR